MIGTGLDDVEEGDKGLSEESMRVANDFCEWVEQMRGTDQVQNIEPTTLVGLFASGYETKPALSVPINIVELQNVPPELRGSTPLVQDKPQHLEKLAKKRTSLNATPATIGTVSEAGKSTKEGAVTLATKEKPLPPFQTGGNIIDPNEEIGFIKLRYGAWYLRM